MHRATLLVFNNYIQSLHFTFYTEDKAGLTCLRVVVNTARKSQSYLANFNNYLQSLHFTFYTKDKADLTCLRVVLNTTWKAQSYNYIQDLHFTFYTEDKAEMTCFRVVVNTTRKTQSYLASCQQLYTRFTFYFLHKGVEICAKDGGCLFVTS